MHFELWLRIVPCLPSSDLCSQCQVKKKKKLSASVSVRSGERWIPWPTNSPWTPTHTNNLGCHGRNDFQRNCNFSYGYPSFFVDPVDHNATSVSATVFQKLPTQKRITFQVAVASRLSMILFLFSLRANVSPVVCFLICCDDSRSCQYRDLLGDAVWDLLNRPSCFFF